MCEDRYGQERQHAEGVIHDHTDCQGLFEVRAHQQVSLQQLVHYRQKTAK